MEIRSYDGAGYPAKADPIVAARGDIFSGLWYPVIIALLTSAIGILFVKETKDSEVYHQD